MEDKAVSNDDPGGDSDIPIDVPEKQKGVWQCSAREIEARFRTTITDGLSQNEAAQRLSINGPNELTFKKKSQFVRFIKQFNNSIIYILIAAALITLWVHHYSDFLVIGLVIIANALIGYLQEMKADQALEKIRKLLSSQNYVTRDGKKLRIPSEQLVIGDVVTLEAGDSIPADMHLVSADNLKVMESILTGEGDSAGKTEHSIDDDRPSLTDLKNMVFAATDVTQGSAAAVVISTGTETQRRCGGSNCDKNVKMLCYN